MRFACRAALCFPFVLASAGTSAQIYVCKDAAGRTITSDRSIPECADRVMRELDKAGRTRREIRPPPTAEEKRQIQLQEERRKADDLAAQEQRANDRLLRSRFRHEDDIEASRMRLLAPKEDQLRRERATLAAAEKQQQKTQAETDSLKKRNSPVPAELRQQLDDEVQAVGDAMNKIMELEAETSEVNLRHDTMRKRFRELHSASAAR